MVCGFAMGTDGPVARQCGSEKCEMWVASGTGKGQCVLKVIPKKLQFIGDMLSGIDDTLKEALELKKHITGQWEE